MTTTTINTNFLKEWTPQLFNKVESVILHHFLRKRYMWMPTHDYSTQIPFYPRTFDQIDEKLGLAYTSSSDYAAYWVCNSGYLRAGTTHNFIGFAINTDGEVIGIAWDEKENEIFIKL